MKLQKIIFVTMLLSLTVAQAEEESDKTILRKAQKDAQALVKKYSNSGEKVLIVAIPENELDLFFPKSGKREKVESRVLIADDKSVFQAKISPGGQSTLTASMPNLRVKKVKDLAGDSKVLAEVDTIGGTTRINPLTMDEAYMATNFYQKALNNYGLVPKSTETEFLKLNSKYAKVIYVPFDKTGAVIESKRVHGGLHLVNHHPVKFLALAQTERYGIEAVARSRYNVVNVQEKLGFTKADPETEIYSSLNSSQKTTPYRVEVSWSADDAKKVELRKMLDDIYSAPLKYSGEKLYQELAKNMDVDQMFKFLALNHIVRNGDISDEYFWYTQRDNKTGKLLLRIMPQDGDDLLKGAHLFPFNKEQIGLIARDKMKVSGDFIFNFEDPLFRTFKKDPYLYHEYLKTYQSLAKDLATSPFLERELKAIEKELSAFANDPEVLRRGATDEIGKAYQKDSFAKRAQILKDSIKGNANASLAKLENGKLSGAYLKMLDQKTKVNRYKCSQILKKVFLGR